MALPYDKGKAFLRVPPAYRHDGFGHDGTDGCVRKLPHTGIDVNTVKWRDTTVRIRSVWGGRVARAGFDKEAGWYVIIAERDGGFWTYGHHTSLLVKAGDDVAEGEPIGFIGMSGQSTGVHCHIGRATSLRAAIASIDGYTPKKLGRSTKAWADSLGLTDPLPHIYKSLEPRTAKPAPAKAPEQTEEDELMGAKEDIIAAFEARVTEAESRMRADTRGFIMLDVGDGTLSDEQAPHAVLFSREGPLVLHPPVLAGLDQIGSLRSSAANLDYRWVDGKRPVARLVTPRFINRVKDTLTARNYFGDDRQVTVEEAWAWIAKHEAAKAAEASGQ